MKPRPAAALAALLGLVVPLVVEGIFYLHPFMAGAWLLLIWPSSIMTMALFHPSWSDVVFVLTVSTAINIVLYAGVGWFAGFVYSRLGSPEIRTTRPSN